MKSKTISILSVALSAVLLALLTWVYIPSFDNPFVFDDQHSIVDNANIRTLENIPKFFSDVRYSSSLPNNQGYRPIVTTSLAIDYYLADGLDPVVFHRSMYIVFVLQLIALFFFIRKIFQLVEISGINSDIGAVILTSIYGFHTALAETLNYTISRSDSYSTFFVVLALSLYSRGGIAKKFHLYLLPVVLAAFTKETAVATPALIFFYSLLFSETKSFLTKLRQAFFESLPALITIILVFALYFSMTIDAAPRAYSRFAYFVTQIYVTAHYLMMFFLPVGLNADSDLKVFVNLVDDRILYGAYVHLTLLSLVVLGFFRKHFVPTSFGLIWFYVSLSPTSSIVPIEDAMNDHRMFFPFVGLSIAFGWLLVIAFSWLQSRVRPIIAKCVLVLCFGTYLALHSYGLTLRHQVWGDKEALWKDVVLKSPQNGRGLINYGISLMGRGELKGARKYFNEALRLWPNYSYVHINLGVLNGAEKFYVEAEKEFRLAIILDPKNPYCYRFYASWLKSKARYSESLTQINKALAISPGYEAAIELKNSLLETLNSPLHKEFENLKVDFENGSYENVISNGKKFYSDRERKVPALIWSARSMAKLKRFDEAKALLLPFLKETPVVERELKSIQSQQHVSKNSK